MSDRRRFPKAIVAAIRDGKILGIRAGTKPHRVLGIWAVVVEGRVFVRSYSLKPRSWYRTFLEEPRGIVEVDGKQIPVRPVFTRSERLKKLVDRAYAEKFHARFAHLCRRFQGKEASRFNDGTGSRFSWQRAKGEAQRAKCKGRSAKGEAQRAETLQRLALSSSLFALSN